MIGAALSVHRILGPGFVESIYERALMVELDHRGIPYARQALYHVKYRGQTVGEQRIDLFVAGLLVVEIKAVHELAPVHFAQTRSYIRAACLDLGLLINFNARLLREKGIHRVICTVDHDGF